MAYCVNLMVRVQDGDHPRRRLRTPIRSPTQRRPKNHQNEGPHFGIICRNATAKARLLIRTSEGRHAEITQNKGAISPRPTSNVQRKERVFYLSTKAAAQPSFCWNT